MEHDHLARLQSNLTRGLSQALVASAGGQLAEPDAVTAAREVLRGHGLPPQVERLFGGSPVAALVSFDADRIQGWVFGSERVQVAKGASLTLDHLNATVHEMVGNVAGIHGVVYSAGGGGMLFARSDDDLPRIERDVQRWLESRSHELTFTVTSLPLVAADLRPSAARAPLAGDCRSGGLHRFDVVDGLQGALVRLQVKVRQIKDSRPREGGAPPRLQARPGSAAERCPSCGRRPPAKTPGEDDGPDTWCAWCLGLYRANRDRSGRPAGASRKNEPPPTFSDLAAASNRARRYLAFVAIDGNAMGAIVQSLGTFPELAAFSHATTEIFTRARQSIKAVLSRGFLQSDWDGDRASLSLLSGGDEVTFVLPSAAAPLVVVEALHEIEAGFDTACGRGGLLHEAFASAPESLRSRLRQCGAAAGLILAHHHYPVRLLRLYANALQKEAKRSSARSSVAWRLLTDSSPLVETAAGDQPQDELPLEAFERLVRDTESAIRGKVPLAALRGIADQIHHEREALALLAPVERDEALPLLAANFFRYQLARSEPLRKWWGERRGAAGAQVAESDDVASWLAGGGARRLNRLLELLALEPDARDGERRAP